MSPATAIRFGILHPVYDKLALLKFIGPAGSIVSENDHNYMRVIRNRQHPVTLSERNLMVLSGRVKEVMYGKLVAISHGGQL